MFGRLRSKIRVHTAQESLSIVKLTYRANLFSPKVQIEGAIKLQSRILDVVHIVKMAKLFFPKVFKRFFFSFQSQNICERTLVDE